uniref:putative small proline-rich protein 5 n=1 Tax=Agelaius phoeniceus TaxID=39638 RepID=UPI0023EDF904|nr:putative small proline-rich protein 5 [Agelaius phoeniceus]
MCSRSSCHDYESSCHGSRSSCHEPEPSCRYVQRQPVQKCTYVTPCCPPVQRYCPPAVPCCPPVQRYCPPAVPCCPQVPYCHQYTKNIWSLPPACPKY